MSADQRKRTSNNERASLVPASAVIPALRVYTNTAAVKTLVADIGPTLPGWSM